MTTYQVTGLVEEVQEAKTFPSGFTKRDVIVDTSNGGKYPSPVPFTFKKDRVQKLDGIHKGDVVTVSFTVDGRRWDGANGTRFFVDLTGWDISPEQAQKVVSPAAAKDHPEVIDNGAEDADNLPF